MRKLLSFVSFFLCLSLAGQVPVVPSLQELHKPFGTADLRAFAQPEKVFYPQTWFHFIGGNVSKKGITADLEAIASAGFAGVQLFHGQFGSVWPGTDAQITCLSPSWDDAVQHVAQECKRLGLRFTMQGCPGWAMAGGPWIKPEQAMRHLVWSRTDVTPSSDPVTLPVPQPSSEEWRNYQDVTVIAFPTPLDDTGVPLQASEVRSNQPGEWNDLLRGEAKSPLHFAPVSGDSLYWVEITYPENTVVRTVEFPSINSLNHAWCYEPGVNLKVEAIMPDGKVETILHADLPQSNWQDDRPMTFACTETSGVRKYRVTIRNQHDMVLSALKLFSASRKNGWESEAAWILRSIERTGESVTQNPQTYVKMEGMVDLTGKMDAAGHLNWKAPAGKWTVLRIGHVNTGMRNAPAPEEGTGWECDKLSTVGSDAQFDGYLGRLSKEGGPLASGLLNGALFDSWECKTQTWTPNMESEFYQRTHYELRKWIPALFGYVVDNPERTTGFLNDWRRVVGELFVDNFYGNLARRAKDRGLTLTYETAAGDVFPADMMEYFKYADVPMCEFWQPFSEGYVGSLNFKPIKPTASAARLYGKPRVAAESFTSFSHTWDENFQALREVANVNMIEGVSHLVFHTYTHNPQVGFLPPGTSFSGAGIGTPFLRGQTWWKYMPNFTTYLARCTYLLERGRPVSDVLWYLGDEVDHKPNQEAPFPAGFKYDYCNTDVLLHRLSVEQGQITTPEGLKYKVLWLPQTTRMLPQTAEKLLELIRQGAVIVGDAPRGIATLIGGDEAQKRLDAAAQQIWGESPSAGVRTVGQGKVLSGMALSEALRQLNLTPDVRTNAALWLHRQADHADWYYVCAPKEKGFRGTVDFRCTGRVQLWNPVDGTMQELPSQQQAGRTSVQLDLPQAGSCFVVFRDEKPKTHIKSAERVATVAFDEPWTLQFPEGWGISAPVHLQTLKPWKDLDLSAEGRAFSGTVEYTSTFEVDRVNRAYTYTLDLGDVERIAEVYINGQWIQTLWGSPYRVEVSKYLRSGRNTIQLKVTNTWFNRLVYDAGQPENLRKTWVLHWPSKDAALRESGLLGPVSLVIER